MIDVLIALLPAVVAGIYFYGLSVLNVIITSVVFSVGAEVVFNVVTKRKQTIKDLSAVVTGLIVALILPPFIPLWTVAIGSVFATLVVKLFFGGVGSNFMNPAATAKVLIIASWTAAIVRPAGFAAQRAAVSLEPRILALIVGQGRGNIGEVSILAIIIGGLYLALRRKISLVAPIFGLLSAGVTAALLGRNVQTTILTGALFFAAMFLATEEHTTPKRALGQAIFGTAFGIMSIIIMVLGYNPEGPYYAVIFLNLFTPVLNSFAGSKKRKEITQ
jgi:Na+-translocating ferredoxin:NAD+ oxidoreductase subunit D